MSQFIEAVNANGVKQRIPAEWLEEGHPFAAQFSLPPSAVPSAKWTVAALRDYATAHDIDLGDASSKADILAAIAR